MTLCIDVGGTKLCYELIDKNKIVQKKTINSSTITLRVFLDNFLNYHKNISNICISYAGQIKDGVIISAPNIKVDEHKIKEYIQNKYHINLFIENDLNCAVLAEARYYQSNDICAVFVGTGLGLGVISSSKLISGYDHIATELGHIPYKPSPFKCKCGKNNCIELFASGSGLLKQKKHKHISTSIMLEELKNSSITEEKEIYDEFIKALLTAIGSAVTLFNPKIVVLGGGVIMHNRWLKDIINSKLKHYAMPLALKNLSITISQFENASLEGTKLLRAKG